MAKKASIAAAVAIASGATLQVAPKVVASTVEAKKVIAVAETPKNLPSDKKIAIILESPKSTPKRIDVQVSQTKVNEAQVVNS